jgi:hypothetical protein
MTKNILTAIIRTIMLFMSVALIVYIITGSIEYTMYITGGILQFVGVFLVFWGLILIYCDVHGLERPFVYIKRRLNIMLIKIKLKKAKRREPVSVNSATIRTTTSSVKAINKPGTIEELYEHFSREIKGLNDAMREREERLTNIIKKEIKIESDRLTKQDTLLNDLLNKISIGNMRLELEDVLKLVELPYKPISY